ncbi:MAG: hypothetical protein JWM28_3657 [Chitinophagaceae bacterium]|nr:hypothetical protein [Chitinophagaceae bacterium]
MKINFSRALVLFFTAYVIVTVLATAISIIYAIVYKTPAPAPGITVLKSESFAATVPYHVLLMFFIWPLFAWKYFQNPRQKISSLQSPEIWHLSFCWLISAIVVDFVGFVLIRHPYSLTPHEFYIDYQPWISLIYCAIFLSPWVYVKFSQMMFK